MGLLDDFEAEAHNAHLNREELDRHPGGAVIFAQGRPHAMWSGNVVFYAVRHTGYDERGLPRYRVPSGRRKEGR